MIWGGENVEMSVRVWRCGGSLLAAPCSHLGHVYREVTPHTIPGGIRARLDTVNINTARFAEVWLDEYRDFYYYLNPAAKNVELGDLDSRRKILKDLRCHSFQWFLDTVYRDSSFPSHARYVGQLAHQTSGDCLDALTSKGGATGMKQCHGLGGLQTFVFKETGEVMTNANCMVPKKKKKSKYDDDNPANDNVKVIETEMCDFSSRQKWHVRTVDPNQGVAKVIHSDSGLCLTYKAKDKPAGKSKTNSMLKFLSNVVTDLAGEAEKPVLDKCSEDSKEQLWLMNEPASWQTNSKR